MTDALRHDEEALAMEQIIRNQLAIRELEEQNDMLKQFFKDRPEQYPAGTKIKRGNLTLTVTPNTRIDNTLAKANLSYGTLNKITKSVVDPTKARRLLSDEDLAKITKTYDNKLIFGWED